MNIELGQFGNKLRNMYIFGSRPVQDWQRIMVVAFSIILGVFIWSYFFYFSVQTSLMSDSGEATDFVPVKDKEAEIKSVIEKYQGKEASWAGMTVATATTAGAKVGVVATTTNASTTNNTATSPAGAGVVSGAGKI